MNQLTCPLLLQTKVLYLIPDTTSVLLLTHLVPDCTSHPCLGVLSPVSCSVFNLFIAMLFSFSSTPIHCLSSFFPSFIHFVHSSAQHSSFFFLSHATLLALHFHFYYLIKSSVNKIGSQVVSVSLAKLLPF